MKKFLFPVTSILFAFCLMITLLITSVEAVVYWFPGYFEREYAKYNVTETVNMTMEDLLDVTDQMMAYLRGDRADLHVRTAIGGVEREFFNEKEIAHMEDVQGLFLSAMALRRGCGVLMIVLLILFLVLKADFKRTVPKWISIGTGIFFGAAAIIAAVISSDFTRYFIMFHHMFFSNDLWILDPATDLLINIVPEGFFRDTVFSICCTFFLWAAAVLLLCLLPLCKYRKKAN